MSNRIYIIGMAGSGKTTIGKALAKTLNYKFIDINEEIEKNASMFIDEIINHYGYETVSNTETELLKKFTEDKLVIACNDALVDNRSNKKVLNGTVIYLDVDNEKLEKRLENEYPKLAYQNIKIEDLAQKRFLSYRNFSNHIIDNNSEDIQVTIDAILNIL